MTTETLPIRFGKYILLDRIASGGMAEVFRAKVTGAADFERVVAIKCMLPHLARDDQFTKMFIDEAKMASLLSHANISQIYELGNHNGRLYLVMEFISGHDLRHILKTSNKLGLRIPFPVVAYMISRAAEGLDFAHRKRSPDGRPLNLVHRDVSPQNILMSFEGEVKVVDFGIAKAEQRATETQAGVLKGKFAYMAPEQVRGVEVDHRSDIYALGIVLHELLTGTKLFRGQSDLSVLEKVRQPDIPAIRDAVPNAPPEFDLVLRRALAAEPNKRFANAHDMAEALQPLMIDNNRIVGARSAAEYMRALYAEEVEALLSGKNQLLGLEPPPGTVVNRPVSSTVLLSGPGSGPQEELDPAKTLKVPALSEIPMVDDDATIDIDSVNIPRTTPIATPRPKPSASGPLPGASGWKPDEGSGSHRVRVEPTDSGSIRIADLERDRRGPKVLLRVLILLIVLLMSLIGYVVIDPNDQFGREQTTRKATLQEVVPGSGEKSPVDSTEKIP